MTEPYTQYKNEEPTRVIAGKVFEEVVHVLAYNPGKVKVCVQLAESLPCSFIDDSGKPVKQICMYYTASTPSIEKRLPFKLLIKCNKPATYSTKLVAIAQDSADEVSEPVKKWLIIEC